MITVIGSYVSPFVRKVLACLELMQLDHRIDQPAFHETAGIRGATGSRADCADNGQCWPPWARRFTPQTVGGTEPRPGAMRS